MRIAITGGAGFIGRVLVRQIVARGDDVVALVRDPDAAVGLAGPHVELVRSDLQDVEAIRTAIAGADGLIHAAGSYRVGIPSDERPAMLDANLGTTERVIDAAMAARVPRTVYLSSVVAFGNTHGRIPDETYRRDPREPYLSYYDETKWLTHLEVERRIAGGEPIVIVQPGTVYGPHDHSSIGQQLAQAHHGTLPFVALGGLGVCPVHVEDLATGILLAIDRGRLGRSYILAGPNVRLVDALAISARVGGHGLPRLRIPDWPLRVGARLAPNQGARFGLSPNLREIVSSSVGVTYWGTSARAAAELGYVTRDMASGFADAFADAAAPPAPAAS
jgi:dihydroflavonol-4-reductase